MYSYNLPFVSVNFIKCNTLPISLYSDKNFIKSLTSEHFTIDFPDFNILLIIPLNLSL